MGVGLRGIGCDDPADTGAWSPDREDDSGCDLGGDGAGSAWALGLTPNASRFGGGPTRVASPAPELNEMPVLGSGPNTVCASAPMVDPRSASVLSSTSGGTVSWLVSWLAPLALAVGEARGAWAAIRPVLAILRSGIVTRKGLVDATNPPPILRAPVTAARAVALAF